MTPEEINTAIQKSVAEALKPITTQLAALGETVKPITELQTQVKGLVEKDSAATIAAKPGEKKPEMKEGGDGASGALTTESATALFKSMLDERDKAAATTAQSTAAHEAWVKKHAPKLAGTSTGNLLFAGAKDDAERKTRLDQYIADLKATGVKAPDLGATAAGEGGEAATADAKEAQHAAALAAAGKMKSTQLG